jgi:hypothetical protein
MIKCRKLRQIKVSLFTNGRQKDKWIDGLMNRQKNEKMSKMPDVLADRWTD